MKERYNILFKALNESKIVEYSTISNFWRTVESKESLKTLIKYDKYKFRIKELECQVIY